MISFCAAVFRRSFCDAKIMLSSSNNSRKLPVLARGGGGGAAGFTHEAINPCHELTGVLIPT